MTTRSISCSWILLLPLLWIGAVAGAAEPPWEEKIDPGLLERAAHGETEMVVLLSEQADLSRAAELETKIEKGRYVFETLTEVAGRTQPAVIDLLLEEGVEYRSLWVANMIWVRGGAGVAERLARRTDIAHIYANPKVRFAEPFGGSGAEERRKSPAGIEWNISQVNGPGVWAAGVSGQGAVIGGVDTGYEWDHAATINQYRGWNGLAADHNYNWHDAIHDSAGGGICGPNSPEPCDDYGHGTHTMGTMVGDDGGGNQIGLAPQARWIGCRCMDQGYGTPARYSECLQWMIAPTDLNDQNPDPSQAPHVINNSWSCPPSEGCTDPNVLKTVVDNVKAAGIVVAVSAGNGGSDCSTVDRPIAIYDASFSIGATDSDDNIAGFSSRGQVTIDGSGRLKPDVSAPGVNVRSCVPGGGYVGLSGTSMAAPHVAGTVALLVAANPDLAGHVDVLEGIVEQTAIPRTASQSCGGIPGSQIPNNTYGHGRIDAYAAYLSALSIETSVADAGRSPSSFRLMPNAPNPFNPATLIQYELPARSYAAIRVYDVVGRQVRELVGPAAHAAGRYSVTWDGLDDSGRDVSSGVYFYRLETDRFSETRRMVLVR